MRPTLLPASHEGSSPGTLAVCKERVTCPCAAWGGISVPCPGQAAVKPKAGPFEAARSPGLTHKAGAEMGAAELRWP